MNRARKKKALAGAVVVTSTAADGDSEDDAHDDAALEPGPPDPLPPPPPAPLVDAALAQEPNAAVDLYLHLERAREAESAARRLAAKKLRRWHKAKTTYITSGKYSRYDEPSIVKRVEQRLFTADCELALSRAQVVQCRGRFLRLRTVLALYEKMRVSDEPDLLLRRF